MSVTWSTCVEANLGRYLSSVTFRDKSLLSCNGVVCLTFGPKISKIVFIGEILDMSRARIERAVLHCGIGQPEVLLDNRSFLARALMSFYLRVKLEMLID